LDQIGRPAVWSYHFYSPERQRLYIIRVDPDGQINTFEHIRKITLPPPLLAADSWVIDSPAALAIWLDHGGARLVQRNPGLEVLIQLRPLKNQPNPVWMVIGSDKRTGDLHIVAVEAGEGKVVSTSSAGG
ncbi:MAG: hypothetical protein AB1801_26515, partial [Chloroflexota bacterium]